MSQGLWCSRVILQRRTWLSTDYNPQSSQQQVGCFTTAASLFALMWKDMLFVLDDKNLSVRINFSISVNSTAASTETVFPFRQWFSSHISLGKRFSNISITMKLEGNWCFWPTLGKERGRREERERSQREQEWMNEGGERRGEREEQERKRERTIERVGKLIIECAINSSLFISKTILLNNLLLEAICRLCVVVVVDQPLVVEVAAVGVALLGVDLHVVERSGVCALVVNHHFWNGKDLLRTMPLAQLIV